MFFGLSVCLFWHSYATCDYVIRNFIYFLSCRVSDAFAQNLEKNDSHTVRDRSYRRDAVGSDIVSIPLCVCVRSAIREFICIFLLNNSFASKRICFCFIWHSKLIKKKSSCDSLLEFTLLLDSIEYRFVIVFPSIRNQKMSQFECTYYNVKRNIHHSWFNFILSSDEQRPRVHLNSIHRSIEQSSQLD